MIDRGIWTSPAWAWLHLFPLMRMAYSYRVEDMRAYLIDHNRREIGGRSKSGAITGRGYLVRKLLPFIQSYRIEERLLAGVDWRQLTDREAGLMAGEPLAIKLANLGVIFPEVTGYWRPVNSAVGQFSGVDMMADHFTVEVKTEVLFSENLFVQTAEYRHNVHALRGGGNRFVSVPRLS